MYTLEECKKYSNELVTHSGTYLLGYRDLPELMKTYSHQQNGWVLDYGCGAGRSTRFLRKLGFENIIGVDINPYMLSIATSLDHQSFYKQITDFYTGLGSFSLDYILSVFVCVELRSFSSVKKYFEEASRLLKKKGLFFIVNHSFAFFQKNYDWVSYDQKLYGSLVQKSSDCSKVYLKDLGLLLEDTYWSQDDLIQLGMQVDLNPKKVHYPIGMKQDLIDWKDEAKTAPYVITVFEKN